MRSLASDKRSSLVSVALQAQRLAFVAAIVAVGSVIASCPAPSPSLADAQALYASHCALCHGDKGEGYKADAANALANPHFLAIASDRFLSSGIEKGRPGTVMSAWGKAYGGPLDEAQIGGLIRLLRSWESLPRVEADPRPAEGSRQRGALLYETHCSGCHGKEGQGQSYMSLNHPEFLNEATDGFLRYSIQKGRPPTPMPAYESQLTPQGIEDIIVLLRSWQTPSKPPDVLPPRPNEPLLSYPTGEPPSFPKEGRFIAAAEVAQALQEKRALILVDARPPGDYVRDHIAGALSIPFYDVQASIAKLPKDRWIIAYCACPHAESGIVYEALQKEGFDRIKVLDEGYKVWKERGYPTKAGALP